MADWMKQANCRDMELEIFFPENGINYDPFAREVCFSCEVQEECLVFAVDNAIDYGLWGGMSPRQRDEWRWKHRRKSSVS